MAFNDFDDEALLQHRIRMRLILDTPALQAHSTIRYAAWRGVISDFVANRLSLSVTALLPQLVGHVSLALALTAYEYWLEHPDRSLGELLDSAMGDLRDYLD